MDDLWSDSFFPHSSHPRPLALLPYSFICCIPSCPDLFQLFFFFCRGRIRGWTGRFYERGVYVSMWVFVTPHLNPHHSFVCFFGLFIVRTLPFSCSSFLQRPSVPTPDYPQQSRTWRLTKTGVATTHSNNLPMKMNAFFTDLQAADDETLCRNVRYPSTSDTAPHPRWIESPTAPLPKHKNSQAEFICHLNERLLVAVLRYLLIRRSRFNRLPILDNDLVNTRIVFFKTRRRA